MDQTHVPASRRSNGDVSTGGARRRRRRVMVAAAIAVLVAVLASGTASAHTNRHAELSAGNFVTLPDGETMGHSVTGQAVMLRQSGSTMVWVHVAGLDAGTTYPSHVHNAPCSATPAGGSHYQNVAGVGPDFVNATNEIWPAIATDASGASSAFAFHSFRARPDAMSIVIHYPADTSIRLACVDLAVVDPWPYN